MKILILGNSIGGIFNFRREIIQKMINKGYEVHISAPKEDEKLKMGDAFQELTKMKLTYHDLKLDRRGVNPLKDLKIVFEYIKLLKEIKPNIVLSYTAKPNIYGGIACQISKKRFFPNITGLGTAIYNKSIVSKILILLYKFSFKGADIVFFQNENSRQYFLEKKILLKEKSELVPGSGINLTEFYPLPKERKYENLIVLFFGRIQKDKGINELLSVSKRLKEEKKKVEIWIVGHSEEDEIEKEVKELDRQSIIKYFGFNKNMKEIIKEADVVINPSYHEGMSNALLEGGAMGKLLLASDIPGCKEIIKDKNCLFEKGNKLSIYEKINYILSLDEESKKNIIKEQVDFIKKNFDREIIIETLLNKIK